MSEPNTDGCRHLEIYKIAHALGIRIHAMTLRLPFFEMREEGSQVRRSSKSVSSQIVEGYRLRKYRDKFLLYLHGAAGSADETREHLDYLFKTGSLKDAAEYSFLAGESARLLAKLLKFIIGVERHHSKPYYLRPQATGGGEPPIRNESSA
ncbi:MAG TPA: four helix bundle protein [Planctomycetota bacterium]|nr:four helix bundle protein [Planctomycetota bacterium]